MRRAIAVVMCVLSASTIAACGSDTERAVPSTSTVTLTESVIAGSTPPVDLADTPVDPRTFYGDGAAGTAYYFRSPSGNIKCGIGFADPNIRPGCQAVTSVPSNTGMTCKNAGNSLYAVTMYPSNADSHCVNQPVYVGNSQNDGGPLGGKTLQYGQVIDVQGVVCRSTSYGITCTSEKGDFGFVLARDRNTTF